MLGVIPTVPNIESVRLYDCEMVHQIHHLRMCANLTSLDVSWTTISEVAVCGMLPNLHTLILSHCKEISCFASLVKCASLRLLHLDDTVVSDDILRVILPGMPHLEELSLGGCNQLRSLDWLRVCPIGLRHLDLTAARIPEDSMFALGLLPMLQIFVLSRYDAVTPLVSSATTLKSLTLRWSRVASTSMSEVSLLKQLEFLDVSFCVGIVTTKYIEGCSSLAEIDLTSTHVTNEGLAGLTELPHLATVKLSMCKNVTDTELLSQCRSLRCLHLDGTKVTDEGLHGVGALSALRHLDLAGCYFITSLAALQPCRALDFLNVSSTRITHDGLERGGEALHTVHTLRANYCSELRSVECLGTLGLGLRSLCLLGNAVQDGSFVMLRETRGVSVWGA
eukprot:PhF_6_TR10072/c1_g1_i2/m.15627